jgi:hypothetical protein
MELNPPNPHGTGQLEASPSWRGGRTVTPWGYVLVKAPNHPHANARGYVREHRLVMEGVLGRYLEPWEVVHHINGDKRDNRPENLAVTTQAAHVRGHAPQRRQSNQRDPVTGRWLRNAP